MRMCKGVTVLLLGVIAFSTLICCSNKKCTSPIEPAEPDFYLMKDYFPLDYGDNWTWEVVSYPVSEPYVDGDSSLGEPYIDTNQNGIYDFGETYEDVNLNGKYDSPNDPWTPGIPYVDRNSNGQYDAPNDKWDPGEPFLDLDGNSVCSTAIDLTLYASILYPYPEDNLVTRGGQFLGIYSDGQPGGIWGDVDVYSNDNSGLRWHRHVDRTKLGEFLGVYAPTSIKIANDSLQLGDSVGTTVLFFPATKWSSIFEATEDVSVAAGTFKNCLKFRTVASGWINNMYKYNGTSYQWYAKGVGLVKSEGPAEGEYWLLKSAKVGGKNYP
jgi:hypothetical protein